MALGSQPRWTVRPADTAVGIDVGLRDYMLRVYNYMTAGVALTGSRWACARETARNIHEPAIRTR